MASQDDIEAAKSPVVAYDADLSPALAEKRRIKYDDDDDIREVGHPLRRTQSNQSVRSTQSFHSRRTVDPAVALPIQYRTLSFNIEESQSKTRVDTGKRDKRNTTSEELADVDWHTLSEAEICKDLSTDPRSGLSKEQITAALTQYGKNINSPPPSRLLQKIFWYFFGGFGTVLLLGGILVFVSWKPLGQPPAEANLALAIVLLVVFAIQAAFNAWQDFSSSRVMKSITGMLPEECHVLRDGQQVTIHAPDMVPGDILLFKAGSKLPADIRFSEVSSDAKFDRSILTGESAPLAAVTEATDQNYLETRNVGFAGTHCTSGSGVGIVVSTGDRTVFGRIAQLTSKEKIERTPLQDEVVRFVVLIVSLMIIMNIVVLGVWGGYIRKAHPDYMPVATLIVDMVSVGIAFVPGPYLLFNL